MTTMTMMSGLVRRVAGRGEQALLLGRVQGRLLSVATTTTTASRTPVGVRMGHAARHACPVVPAVKAWRLATMQQLTDARCLATRTRAFSSTPSSAEEQENIVIEPEKKDRTNEPVERKRARLLYQSRKRGIKEMDLIMATYADQFLADMTPEQLHEYDVILNDHENEWDMFKWLTEKEELPEYLKNSSVMRDIIAFTKNTEKEQRTTMPPLRQPKQ